MAQPTPRWTGTEWALDLREPWKLGRRIVDAPPPPPGHRGPTVEALHAAYALKARLEASAPPSAQLDLPRGGRTLAQVIDEWLVVRKHRRGRRWCLDVCKRLREELGATELAEMEPPGGTRILFAWRDRLRASGVVQKYQTGKRRMRRVGAAAMRSRIYLLRLVLRWAASPPQFWLHAVPMFPDPRTDEEIDNRVPIYKPLSRWVDEATVRAVRDVIYMTNHCAGAARLAAARTGAVGTSAELCEDLRARRRLYLSFGLYGGLRKEELDALSDRSVSPDLGYYRVCSGKTGDDDGYLEKMPDPLRADVEAELNRLRRPWRTGEEICGGPWCDPERVLAVACARLGVPRFGLRDLRRSFAFHVAMAGQRQDVTCRLMHHKDSKMLEHVYRQFPTAREKSESGGAWPVMRTRRPGTGPARILPMPTVAPMAPLGAEGAEGPKVSSYAPGTARPTADGRKGSAPGTARGVPTDCQTEAERRS
jgi:integrase